MDMYPSLAILLFINITLQKKLLFLIIYSPYHFSNTASFTQSNTGLLTILRFSALLSPYICKSIPKTQLAHSHFFRHASKPYI